MSDWDGVSRGYVLADEKESERKKTTVFRYIIIA